MAIPRVLPALALSAVYLLGHRKSGILKDSIVCKAAGISMLLAVYAVLFESREKAIHFLTLKPLAKDIRIWIIFLLALAFPALPSVSGTPRFLKQGILSSLMSFGGGDAYLTITEGLFVDTSIVEKELFFGNIVTVVNVLPGSILCKTLTGIGYFCGYLSGGIIPGLLMALVGFGCSIAASCASYWTFYDLYDSITENTEVLGIGKWIRPIISGLLINVMLSLVASAGSAAQYTAHSTLEISILLVGWLLVILLFTKNAKLIFTGCFLRMC